MLNSKEDDFGGEGSTDGFDLGNEAPDDVLQESDSAVSSREVENSATGSSGFSIVSQGGRSVGLTERLRDILSYESDADLLLQQSDRENNVLQWLQALDLQVIGACRADERLKPLLKLNISSAMAEDPLLVHLSQHFEMPEVGMLARCLCAPLMSVRVGKVIKQGSLLCPTATRGNLNLTLLPSSDLRISFVGDDGCIERLATLCVDSDESVVIEELPADKSGRSFLMRFQGGQVSYFWCSEQSKLHGLELLAKMKDLLERKPSLAQLTGISESRLDCFATHLRAYLLGSATNSRQTNTTVSFIPLEWDLNTQVSSPSKQSSRHVACHSGKTQPLYQGSLSPRSSSFKDSTARNYSLRSLPREKLRQRVETHCIPSFSTNLSVASPSTKEASSINEPEIKIPVVAEDKSVLPLGFLDSLGTPPFQPSSNPTSLRQPSSKVITTSSGSNLFSPYYCWCPPCSSTLQYTIKPPGLSSVPTDSLPPISPLLSATLPNPSINLADAPSLDFPAFLPDPITRAPLPVSSLLSVTSSQQIPTFTPLMCDPIVHIPLVDVCSSGQGYLVSAGPAISIGVPPLHPSLVSPLIPETESLVEKGARETLRLLLGSTQANPQLMEVLPSVLTGTDDKDASAVVGSRGLYSGARETLRILLGSTPANPQLMEVLPSVLSGTDDKDASAVLGSRGLYSGTRDVEAIAGSFALMGLASTPNGNIGNDNTGEREDLDRDTDVFKRTQDFEDSCNCDDDREESTMDNGDVQERLDGT